LGYQKKNHIATEESRKKEDYFGTGMGESLVPLRQLGGETLLFCRQGRNLQLLLKGGERKAPNGKEEVLLQRREAIASGRVFIGITPKRMIFKPQPKRKKNGPTPKKGDNYSSTKKEYLRSLGRIRKRMTLSLNNRGEGDCSERDEVRYC